MWGSSQSTGRAKPQGLVQVHGQLRSEAKFRPQIRARPEANTHEGLQSGSDQRGQVLIQSASCPPHTQGSGPSSSRVVPLVLPNNLANNLSLPRQIRATQDGE